jgi:hypothetical protein
MIAMDMADEDMVYFSESDFISPELHLGTFTAVYQIQPLMHGEYMSGRISF